MRLALPFLLFAAFLLPPVPASSAQAVNPQTGFGAREEIPCRAFRK